MATPEEAVANASAKFAAAESGIQKAIDNLNKMKKDFTDVYEGGPLETAEGVQQFGYLESAEFAAEAQVLAGDLSGILLSVIYFHQRCTGRAVELDLDGLIAMGGGGR